MRILYIQRGLVPPPKDDRLDHFFWLSEAIEGDILLPVWWTSKKEVEEALGPDSYPVHTACSFKYHLLLSGPRIGLRQRVSSFLFYVRKGRQIHREQPFACVVTYGFSLTAFAGIVIKWFTGAKLILEINSEPGKAYLYDTSKPMILRRLMVFGSTILLHIAAWNANRLRLLYPQQLDRFPLLRRVPTSVFHAFVPTSLVKPSAGSEKFVLFAGYPWYLKGADIMIKAFRIVAHEFPDVRLVLRGYYPDRSELERLAGDCSQIEIGNPLPYGEMLQAIANAIVIAHPTRTEGMGRVLVEAMAARRPCVASSVGGIPYYVKHGYNGYLFRTEDVADLAEKLRALLADSDLRKRLSENGFEFAALKLTEKVYVEGFVAMLGKALGQ